MKKSTANLLHAVGALSCAGLVGISNMEFIPKLGVCIWLIGAAIHFIQELMKESANE